MFLMDADKGGRSFPEFIFSTFVTLTSAAALNRAASQMFPVVVSKVFSLGSFHRQIFHSESHNGIVINVVLT